MQIDWAEHKGRQRKSAQYGTHFDRHVYPDVISGGGKRLLPYMAFFALSTTELAPCLLTDATLNSEIPDSRRATIVTGSRTSR